MDAICMAQDLSNETLNLLAHWVPNF